MTLWSGERAENPRAVHSSKAVGEPPTFLGSAVYFAIKQAIGDANGARFVKLDSPATTERIRMVVNDEVSRMVTVVSGEYKPPVLC